MTWHICMGHIRDILDSLLRDNKEQEKSLSQKNSLFQFPLLTRTNYRIFLFFTGGEQRRRTTCSNKDPLYCDPKSRTLCFVLCLSNQKFFLTNYFYANFLPPDHIMQNVNLFSFVRNFIWNKKV